MSNETTLSEGGVPFPLTEVASDPTGGQVVQDAVDKGKEDLDPEQDADAFTLAKELNDVTKNWRSTYVISGDALAFVKAKAQAIFDALNEEDEEEEDDEPQY